MPELPEFKAIIFDMFGVIVPDTSWVYFDRHKADFGGDADYLANLNEQIDKDQITDAQYFKSLERKLIIPARQIEQEMDEIETPNQEVVKLIVQLKEQYKIGLLSNSLDKWLEELLERYALKGLFDCVISSSKSGYIKPQPEIFQLAVKQLSVESSQCVFIDDREVNVLAAEALGMRGVLFKDSKHLKTDLQEVLNARIA